MAERFAREFSGGRIKSFSAGSNPAPKVNELVAAAMREIGLAIEDVPPKSLDQIPRVEYDLVVTMGCGDSCPQVSSKRTEEWQIPDPKKMDEEGVREVRDLLREKVKTVIEKILSLS